MDVGVACAYLATLFARRIAGGTEYVDGGANIIARRLPAHRRPLCSHSEGSLINALLRRSYQRRVFQHQVRPL
jgi:hypothetical protein